MTFLLAALTLGLFGSLHCVGMCGPLALALARGNGSRLQFYAGRLLYNLGRVTTYALLGAAFGLFGSAARLAGWQQALSIATGSAILLYLLLPQRVRRRISERGHVARGIARLKMLFAPLLRSDRFPAHYGIGLLNGLLPCGFVYVGLAGAMTQPGVLESAAFMALFGAGTLPAMLLVSVVPGLFTPDFRLHVRRLLPAGAALLALLLIVRGMSLGIPYLSPKLPAAEQATAPACHQP